MVMLMMARLRTMTTRMTRRTMTTRMTRTTLSSYAWSSLKIPASAL
jgi:hypothetical protein